MLDIAKYCYELSDINMTEIKEREKLYSRLSVEIIWLIKGEILIHIIYKQLSMGENLLCNHFSVGKTPI